MNLSTYFEGVVQAWWADGTQLPSPPSSVDIGLHTDDPTSDGTANEVTASDYARETVTTSNLTVSGSNPTTVQNDNEIEFPIAESEWGNISHLTIWFGSNLLWHGAATETKYIEENDQYRIPANDLGADLS